MAFGPKVEPAITFAEDSANGVTLLTIQGAHTLDFAIAVLDSFAELTALLTTQYPMITVGDSKTEQARSTPDHLLVQSRFGADAAVSLEVTAGQSSDASTFRMDIDGPMLPACMQLCETTSSQIGRLFRTSNMRCGWPGCSWT